MQSQKFMTTIRNVTEKKEKKKLKSLIGFLGANKSITTTEWGERKKKKRAKLHRTAKAQCRGRGL